LNRNDQSLYEDHAQSWWEEPLRFQRSLKLLVRPRMQYFERVTPGWQGLDVLDLGCGGGYMTEALAQGGARLVGVDPSSASLDAARRHSAKEGLEIDYRLGVGEAIPIPDHSADRVVCVDVLEHVQDVEKVLGEVRRVLRSGGIFLFDTVNRNRLSVFLTVTMAEDILRIIPRGTHDPRKFIKPKEMQIYLEMLGFTVDRKKFAGMGPVGISRRGDLVFGLLPVKWLVYLGYAMAGGK
jgi:2-polyprenyl-6-hydroxyphenyl methylase / 3-demethylubiquinone-9 3-methyltransferase